jgi:dTDP-4-amino-4,6-dideoxygalactose transaminase
MTGISYVNLSAQWGDEKEELLPIIESVLESGQYVGSNEIDSLENEIKQAFEVRHVIALNSGTDALMLSLIAIDVGSGDEVITPPNSFIASTAAISRVGATPVFVDVGSDQNIDPGSIEHCITKKTKVIMPVHLTGRVADMPAIMDIADRYNLQVIEDAAQAAGSRLEGKISGSWGRVGCFSAHPLKNFNACGDAGFITTNDDDVARKIARMRNHGLIDRETAEEFGFVSRMDAIQAAILRFRLPLLPQIAKKRRENAVLYRSILDPKTVIPPPDRATEFNTWHTFVIQVEERDKLRSFLASREIETAIHYPIPIHLQPAGRYLGYGQGDFPNAESQANRILSLPVHQYLTEDQVRLVAKSINEFYGA